MQVNYMKNNINFAQKASCKHSRQMLRQPKLDKETAVKLDMIASGWHPVAILSKFVRLVSKMAGIIE